MNPFFLAFAALIIAFAAASVLWRLARVGLPTRHRQPDPIFRPFMDPERRSFASRPIKPIISPDSNPARDALPLDTDRGRIVPPDAVAVRQLSDQGWKDLRARWHRQVQQMRGRLDD